MSLARKHREKFSNIDATAVLPATGGLAPKVDLATSTAAVLNPPGQFTSLAERNKARVLAQATAMAAGEHAAPDRGTPEERMAAQVRLRLQHDLRRLKEIASIERKIAVKREMLPEYAAWVDGLVAADKPLIEDVLPTIMVWRIDVGNFAGALPLAAHVLRHDLPLPSRYERSAAALIAEEIAEAASKLQGKGQPFPLDILNEVDALTASVDMHDEIRAKLEKAIGVELQRISEIEDADPREAAWHAMAALTALRRAHDLHDRVGVKDRIKRLEKLLAPSKEPAASAA
jgi:hypothetical protein